MVVVVGVGREQRKGGGVLALLYIGSREPGGRPGMRGKKSRGSCTAQSELEEVVGGGNGGRSRGVGDSTGTVQCESFLMTTTVPP